MDQEEIKELLGILCRVTADAVACYVANSGESTDEMPEFVMSAGAALGLAHRGRSTILEANAEIIRRRLGSEDDQKTAVAVEAAIEMLGNGKIDLVVLSAHDDPEKRKPIGFVEFKRWKYDHRDVRRTTELLKNIPGAEFGVCVVMRNTLSNHRWHEEIKQSLGKSGMVIAEDIEGQTRRGEPCCIACFANFRTSA